MEQCHDVPDIVDKLVLGKISSDDFSKQVTMLEYRALLATAKFLKKENLDSMFTEQDLYARRIYNVPMTYDEFVCDANEDYRLSGYHPVKYWKNYASGLLKIERTNQSGNDVRILFSPWFEIFSLKENLNVSGTIKSSK